LMMAVIHFMSSSPTMIPIAVQHDVCHRCGG
jgi:hypothetical protein